MKSDEPREKMSIEEISKTAFAKWLVQQGQTAACKYMFECMSDPTSNNSLVWDLLELTGDKRYSDRTLLKAFELLHKAE